MAKMAGLQEFAADISCRGIDAVQMNQGGVAILDRWTLGTVQGDAGFESVPLYVAPAGADERQRLDYRTAAGLTAIKPRMCWDGRVIARQILADFLSREAELYSKGYIGPVLQDALRADADKGRKQLADRVPDLYSYHQQAQATVDKLSSDFGATGETELQQVTYDLRLVDRFAALDDAARNTATALLARGEPGIDQRTMAALLRVPQAISGLDDDTLSDIRLAYFAGAWPATASAVWALCQAIGAAHQVIRTTMRTLGERSSLGPKAALTLADPAHTAWLAADFDTVLEDAGILPAASFTRYDGTGGNGQ